MHCQRACCWRRLALRRALPGLATLHFKWPESLRLLPLLKLLTATLLSALFLAQELGQNALLARVLLEAVGAVARAVGPRFAASGRLLRLALLPLLERLADPCASVAAAAAAALSSVCSNCGCVRARLHDGSVCVPVWNLSVQALHTSHSPCPPRTLPS